jgi:hypothetical protein
VKVVEGSEIYNFPIHRSVHFSSNFGSKSGSNSPAPQHVTLERDVATRQSTRRAPARAAARQGRPLGVRAHGPRPEAALPQSTHTPRPFGFRARPDRVAALPAGPSAGLPCASATADAAAVP